MSAPLIAATIAHLMANTESGAVLVFVPGWREIKDVEDELRTRRWSSIDFNDPERFKIVLLHSLFPSGLTEATDPVPEGCRRILIATDIAETSLTFPDIKYVIDSGKRRSPEYDALSSVNKLYRTWVSKASATQRAGRAGRVKSGEYYALFSEQRHRSMAPFRPPEAMTPEAIQRVILRVRLHFPTIPVEKYFSNWLEPPPQLQLDTALRRLQDEDVLTEHGEVTPFGRLVARLGTSPSMARMILLGVVFQCLDPILVIAAMALHNVPLFTHPDSAVAAMQHRNLRLTLSEGARSDHIALLNAYRTMTRRERTHGTDAACDWAAANDVSLIHYKSVSVGARRLSKVLAQYGLIPDHRMDMANLRSENTALLTALICAGLAPNIAAHASSYRFLTKGGLHAEVPHESLLRPQEWRAGTWMPNPLKGTLCVYSGIHQATDPLEGNDFTLLRDVTPVSELAVALFGGPLNVADGDLLVDGWLPLRTSGSDEAVHQIAKFRELWDSALATTFKGLAVGIGSDASREVKREIAALEDVVQAVVSLLDQDERARLERAAALLPRRELESSNVEDTS
ncbi:P-loop containing nucleoside triphosphate hydrolase protein [Trichodelitschia bisporula]|uniref:P-loop containing nucleoside triphosphate hydrolase protein n=1 Tax=Trichodelitschia bisporula TaxID=703511 RepID=A0A6G1HJE6_9PEZI|nr:P-loop containing nucleoside triphosphate hydrolase protein [Trichodelitschia bisporula]